MEVIELVWLLSRGDSGEKIHIKHDETVGKERCKSDPAGHLLKRKSDNKEVCLFLYDEDMNPIRDATEIEDITSEKLLNALEKESRNVENLEV